MRKWGSGPEEHFRQREQSGCVGRRDRSPLVLEGAEQGGGTSYEAAEEGGGLSGRRPEVQPARVDGCSGGANGWTHDVVWRFGDGAHEGQAGAEEPSGLQRK